MTLIETVLYLALFALVFFSVMQFAMAVAEHNRVAETRGDIERSIIFVTEHINVSFDESDSVDVLNSVFESDSGSIRLNTPSGWVEYELVDGQIMRTSGGQTLRITGSSVSVTRFYLEQILNKGDEVVGARLTLVVGSSKTDDTETIVTAFTI